MARVHEVAHAQESNIEFDHAPLSRQGNATGTSDRFDAGSNVYAVAHQIIALHNDVADMDADAQRQFSLRIGLLDCLRRLYRLHGTGKLNQEAVATALNSRPACLPMAGSIMFVRSARSWAQRSRFVAADELRVADDIGRQDRGEAALLPHSGTPASLKPS